MTQKDTFYLVVTYRPFPSTREDSGWYAFVDRMKVGSAMTIERKVLESKSKVDATNKVHNYIKTYNKEYSYVTF